MTTIRFENTTKNFGAANVISSLNLEIGSGEFFTFVGPSGCGKSTILNMLAGLEQPSRGTIFFDDRPVNALSPRDRDIALVFQNYALYPHMTAFENIAFPLRMKKERKSEISGKVERVAQLLGIAALLGRRPKELSGGQRQRVALARAIVRRPRVFLMDEPLSNLDARLRIEMRGELKRLHQELGITTVYVTHDQSEALGLSDRVAVLEKGAVQQCDAPLTVYRSPANVFVAGFIGIPPMNIHPGTLRSPREIEIEGTVFPLSPDIAAAQQNVLVGVRPEDLPAGREGSAEAVEMQVSVSEPAGAQVWVELNRDNLHLTAMARPEDDLKAGERCYVTMQAGRISLFDPNTGIRLK